MSIRGSAARYARALFDIAATEGGLDKIEQSLAEFSSLLEGSVELRSTLHNPAVPTAVKRGVIDQLVARTQPPAPLAKLLGLLADRGRLELLPALASAYQQRLMDHNGVVQAEIVTAEPLDDIRVAALQQRIASATGRTVLVTRRTEPAIVGGVVAKIGGTVYDGSIAAQLARMRVKLAEHM
jgi:F-type H+-transporting ATPase subunit delta